MTATGLRITGLSAGYRNREVLAGLSLAPIAAGTITAVIGPNGAGKSTLLRALAGLVPARGEVELAGDELLAMRPLARAARVGFMPQTLPAGVALSVLETVVSALKAAGGLEPAALIERRAVAVLERLDILHLALEPLDRLSGGQRQMASLAQAIAREPDLLLLDEPTSALDLRHQVQVIKAVRRFAAQGRTVLIVLHDLAFAARWSDHVVVLDRGGLDSEGAPLQVVTPQMLRRVYGIDARVERCSAGTIQIMTDDLAAEEPAPAAAARRTAS